MLQRSSRVTLMIAGLATLALGACANYVTKSDFDSTVAQLRAADHKQQQQLDQQQQIEQIPQQMKSAFSKYDARIAALRGRIRVDTVTHFAFNDAKLSARDKRMPEGFAGVIREHQPDLPITVQGFADLPVRRPTTSAWACAAPSRCAMT
jgi:peptidoglycan-associated lipoprotein